MVEIAKKGTTENAVKAVCVVLNLVFEIMGEESLAKSPIFLKVKKCVIKRANKTKKVRAKRKFMELRYLRKFVARLFKHLAGLVDPAKRRLLVQQVILFLGLRRFDNIKGLKWGDFWVKEDNVVEIFMARTRWIRRQEVVSFTLAARGRMGFRCRGCYDGMWRAWGC